MPRLRDLQQAFWRAVAGAPGTLVAPDELVAAAVSSGATAMDRLRVYANAYFWRLRDVLAEDFSRLAALLGADRFDDLARDYLRAHPSEHPSVRHVGDRLPPFLAARDDLPPWLADLARLERARVDAFAAPDCQPLAPAEMAAIPPDAWPRLRFVPNPSLAILRLSWPVHELWRDGDFTPPGPASTVLRVWRDQGYRVFHAVMDARAAEALERLMGGATLGVACQAFDDLPAAEAAHHATASLRRWLDDGLLADAVVGDTSEERPASHPA